MNIQDTIQSQYLASLEMLRQAIIQCPDALWDDPAYKNAFWQVAYHTLFFTHLYLQPSEKDFVPWARHRPEAKDMGKRSQPYRKAEILEYLAICQEQVEKQVPLLAVDAPSGFEWLPFNKLETQFYNIRHIQHHTGELCERLGVSSDIGVHWVGTKPE